MKRPGSKYVTTLSAEDRMAVVGGKMVIANPNKSVRIISAKRRKEEEGMSVVYSKVFSVKTGWVMGMIDKHQARPLTESEIDTIAEKLNASPNVAGLRERIDAKCEEWFGRGWTGYSVGGRPLGTFFEELINMIGLSSQKAGLLK